MGNVGCRTGKLNDLLDMRSKEGEGNMKNLAMLGLHIRKHISSTHKSERQV